MEQGEVVAPAAPEQRRPKKRQRTVGGNRIRGDDVGSASRKAVTATAASSMWVAALARSVTNAS